MYNMYISIEIFLSLVTDRLEFYINVQMYVHIYIQ